jgi:ribonuclease-3
MNLEEAIGYSFNNRNILICALTRKAYANEQKQKKNLVCKDQEIFRTLGDAVLKTVLIDLLIESGCTTREEITNRKMELESQEGLAKVGRQLDLGSFILMGAGEKKQKANKKQSVIAETLEALIGAIYLDGGFDNSKTIIARLFRPYLNP